MAGDCAKTASKVLFRLGQILLLWGICCYVVAVATTSWVVRPQIDAASQNINLTQTLVTKNYGIFLACRQVASTNRGDCGSLWDNLNFISIHSAKFVQFLMVTAGILYGLSFVMEVIQFLPIRKFRNFIAKNRMVEMFAGIATVLVITGMVVFAGEIKNKAERVRGQDEEITGWSFIVGLIGLILCVISLVLVTMFRDLPIPGANKKGGTWIRVQPNPDSNGTTTWGS